MVITDVLMPSLYILEATERVLAQMGHAEKLQLANMSLRNTEALLVLQKSALSFI